MDPSKTKTLHRKKITPRRRWQPMTCFNYLYMDNYRGFEHQICPIGTVNFLVGENSTGKSSLLTALSFLIDFPSSNAANDASRHLGSFQDSVSSASKEKKAIQHRMDADKKDGPKRRLSCFLRMLQNREQ